MARVVKHTVRLTREEQGQVQRVAKERGYVSTTAFIRAAIRNELTGRESEVTDAEQRTSATLERLSRDLLRANRAQQALFAVVDTLVKTFLTCVPEPPREGMSQSVARARGRYERFVKSAGQAMVGDSQTLKGLTNHVE
jgi:hypothetical protein